MINFRKKLLFSFLFIIAVTTLAMGSALAGTSISGNSNVYPGKTYTYTITVSENASSIMGTASSSGVLGSQSKTWSKDSSSGMNQSLTASTTITVTIPSSAAIGSTGSITVSGQGSKFNADAGTVSKFTISGSKTVTVVAPPTPPPPTKWELAVRKLRNTEEGGSVTIEMNPAVQKELNMLNEALQIIKERNLTMIVDFGTYQCVFTGSEVGDVEGKLEDIDIGYTMLPAARDTDMIVFTPNNQGAFRYGVTYVLPPNLAIPEGMIYVYRQYPESGKLEYIDAALADENGKVLVNVFAPGQYVVSAESIEGAVGGMNEDTFNTLAEIYATPEPTPSPTPVPTPSPTPQPSPTPEPPEPKFTSFSTWLVVILAVLIAALIGAVVLMKRSQMPVDRER